MAVIEKRKTREGKIKYRVKVRLKGYPTQSETFDRLTDAKRWAQKIESSIREKQFFPTAEARKRTLTELITRYKEEVLPHHKQKWVDDLEPRLKWWNEKLGSYYLADITSSTIVSLRNELVKEDIRGGKKRSVASANRYLSALSHVFSVAVNEWEWLDYNPLSKVKKFKESRGRSRYLSAEELKRLMIACKESSSPSLLLVVVLAVSTGMRRGEILNLRWQDVNLKKGFLLLLKTKNNEPRRVALHGLALELLKERHQIRDINVSLVFPGTEADKPIDIRSAWESARDRAGLEDFRFHDLRHSAASHLAMNGATLRDIAEVLGHKTLRMVKRYSHLSEAHTSQIVAKMNENLFSQI